MKRVIFLAVVLLMVFSALPVSAGNDAPNGPHYNLNLIAVNDKSADMTDTSGHTIFVNDDGKSIINLCEAGTDNCDVSPYGVIDRNATGNNNPALFGLPNPDPDCDGTTSYSVYLRVRGKPNTPGSMMSCIDQGTEGIWCAASNNVEGTPQPIDLGTRNNKFQNVSKDLLYVDVCRSGTDINGDGTWDTCQSWGIEPLFGPSGEGYWWETDITGKKTVQLRFYDVETQAYTDGQVVCAGEPLP